MIQEGVGGRRYDGADAEFGGKYADADRRQHLCRWDDDRGGDAALGARGATGSIFGDVVDNSVLEHFPLQLNRRGIPESAWF
jgi:hypothetical protein